MEELKGHLEQAKLRVSKQCERLNDYIEKGNRRMVVRCQDELIEQFTRYEDNHVALSAKLRRLLTSQTSALEMQDYLNEYEQLEEMTFRAKEKAHDYLVNQEALDLSETVLRRFEELNDLEKDITGELTHLEDELAKLKEGNSGDFRADEVVVAVQLAQAEKNMEKARQLADFIVTNENDAEQRKTVLKKMTELDLLVKKHVIRIKSFCRRSNTASQHVSRDNSTCQSVASSRNNSPDRDVGQPDPGGGLLQDDGQPDEPGGGERWRPARHNLVSPNQRSSSSMSSGSQSLFKAKRMEFPKFSGDMRAYNTFRRDFREIVERDGMYTPEHMSHIIRHECLSGEPKLKVRNIYDLSEIWAKLDDVYNNESEIVQQITKQVAGHKALVDDDYDGFVAFVDLLERAHYDLAALENSSALSNPMTVACILEKSPNWVQKDLVKAMDAAKVPQSEEFLFIFKQLQEMRTSARKLSRLSQKAVTKGGETRKLAKGTTNTLDASQTSEGETCEPEIVNWATGGAGGGSGAGSSSSSISSFKCLVPACTYKNKHMVGQCRAFKKMSVEDKGKFVKSKSLCVLCFDKSHKVADCEKKSTWKPCDVGGCGKWHSRQLHGAKVQGLALVAPQARGSEKIVLLVQEVPVRGGGTCVTLWDSGSTVALITFKAAERFHLTGEKCNFEVTGVGNKRENYNTKLYNVPIVDKSGNVHFIQAYGMPEITPVEPSCQLDKVAGLFDGLSVEEIQRPSGQVDLLVGMNHVALQPVLDQVQGEVALYNSMFGSGKVLGGAVGSQGSMGIGVRGAINSSAGSLNMNVIAHAQFGNVKFDFLTTEAFGVDIPRRCAGCKTCKECQFKNHQISYAEMVELSHIENGLVYNANERKWTGEYPFHTDPGVLQDNYSQAFACMLSTERRLKKRGLLESFDCQFAETVARGVFKELTKTEIGSYTGPVNYISIVEAFKQGPHCTTPLRLCMNSSLKYKGVSLNDLLMKGPSALTDIFNISLGFRSHRVAIVKDISKFYQSVKSVERDQHLRRVLHRPQGEGEVKIYKTTTVNFGDKPAGCLAQCALRSTAKMFSSIDGDAAAKIIEDTYVDDSITGATSKEEAVKISENMDRIAELGGFKYKETVMSGDKSDLAEPRRVVGLGWDSESDCVYINTNVNVSCKKKGVKEEPDIPLEQLVEKFPDVITKRIVWRIVLAQYDMLGLASVFTIRLKLVMRSLVAEEGALMKWDDPVPRKVRDEFLIILQQLLQVKSIMFPRDVVHPLWDVTKPPDLLILCDGSQSAFCALVYVRCELKSGGFGCRLVAGKSRVAPTRKISVPRMELQAAVMGVRLASSVVDGLRFEVGNKWFFTDNAAVLGMIRTPSGSFNEFVGTRVGEIKSKCDSDKEWFWLPTHMNLADMGTRTSTTPADLMPDTPYQVGMEWMRGPRADWPASQTPGQVPQEELVSKSKVNISTSKSFIMNLEKFSSIKKPLRILIYVAKFIAIKVPRFFEGSEIQKSFEERAENFLLRSFQADIRLDFRKGKLDTLRPQEAAVQAFFETDLVVTSGRVADKMTIGYDKTVLPILSYASPLALLYMKAAHNIDHSGADRTLQRSRSDVWIIRGRRLAQLVVNNCFKCKHRNKNLQKQKMAPLHASRLAPAPLWDTTSIDLFGPISVKDFVKRRVSRDCWGVIFVDTVTSAIHLEVTEDYSTDSFLIALKRFINLRGTPRKIHSDPGSQLVGASEIVKAWDCTKISEWTEERSIQWHIVPTASQHFNGCAESMIKVTKRQLTELVKNRQLTRGELDLVFSDVMVLVNTRPLMIRAGSDPIGAAPITPMHLILGRATVDVPKVTFEEKASLTKRLRFLETIKQEFWSKWIAQVFSSLVPSYRWKREYRDVQQGDIVLMKNETSVSVSYKLAVVLKSHKGVDGKVRRVLLGYKNVDGLKEYKKGGYKMMETERAIHGVVVIKPVDWTEDQVETAVSGHEDRPSEDVATRLRKLEK